MTVVLSYSILSIVIFSRSQAGVAGQIQESSKAYVLAVTQKYGAVSQYSHDLKVQTMLKRQL